MAISDKLNYLIETKSKFKDRLNSLGAEIIESTTFRNYLNWLDTFYGDVSDKTDLSVNGVVGRTSQDGDPTPENPIEINNLSGDVEYKVRGKNLFDKNNANVLNGYINASGTITSEVNNRTIYIPCKPNTTYTISKTISQRFRVGTYSSTPQINSTTSNYGGNYTDASITITSGTNDNYLAVWFYNGGLDTKTYQEVIDTLQIEQGTTATSYEPYISESFPLSLKSKNLFDKNNANVLVGYINVGAKIISEQNDRIIYIPCKPNTTYTLQKMVQEPLRMNRFRVATSEAEPTYGMIVNQYYNPGDGKNIEKYTITTNDRANYLIFYCYYTLNNTVTFEEILDSIQIEEGSTATTYEPYYDIELCKISTYKDRIYKQNDKWYLKKNIGKVVFDGSESWSINTSYTYNVFYRTLDNYARISNAQTTYCEYYKGIENAGGIADFGNNYNNSIGVRTANDNIKDIYISNNSITSASDFKTWLSTHNTVVYYVLATPTTTEITEENYPTLYSQLLAIQEFLTKYKINKEFLLDYSSPEIEY